MAGGLKPVAPGSTLFAQDAMGGKPLGGLKDDKLTLSKELRICLLQEHRFTWPHQRQHACALQPERNAVSVGESFFEQLPHHWQTRHQRNDTHSTTWIRIHAKL
jgi:hypothetical protein